MLWLALFLAVLAAPSASGQTGNNVLLVVNRFSPISREIGEYYQHRRKVPSSNICRLALDPDETITRETFEIGVAKPVEKCLAKASKTHRIIYIATTKGVPLRVRGSGGQLGDAAAVDSELTLLPRRLAGEDPPLPGGLRNPFFGKQFLEFDPDAFKMLLVTRLTGYTLDDVKRMIDRSLQAKNAGFFVVDSTPDGMAAGNQWLEAAARALPATRVQIDRERAVKYNAKGVIGYASWGSNDKQRIRDKRRELGFEWLPGAIATEYVSTNGRTFEEPPLDWHPAGWDEKELYHGGAPQSLTGDLIREGATGALGHVYEPYLDATPRPQYLFAAYYEGRTLAESYYLAISKLSWMNVVVGDPLCRLGPP